MGKITDKNFMDKYEIKEMLGRNGTATFYKARHKYLEIDVLIKLLCQEYMNSEQIADKFIAESYDNRNFMDVGLTSEGIFYSVQKYFEEDLQLKNLSNDRRDTKRLSYIAPLFIKQNRLETDPIPVITKDVTEYGICFFINIDSGDSKIRIGDTLRIYESKSDSISALAIGRTKWVTEDRRNFKVGVRIFGNNQPWAQFVNVVQRQSRSL